ncbi:hypothetical protein CUJ89_35555 [Burkholderia pyrrocinia]|uniref:DUF4148 domain-containing protein n=2 Tax=Burkholderia pyrrocinia TaxID=60550 RepID=A0A2Z5N839_BURPY|nr:DUF4148 domain-containing protein [Burkholderia pyrrocinia]AXF25743.1 hypothetical protein CUJ89_35555 [Burkholderia pyrrocinia]
MKVKMIALTFAACAAVATTTFAFAGSPVDTRADHDAPQARQSVSVGGVPKGKTRAEVREELVRAEKDGQLAALDKLYRGG